MSFAVSTRAQAVSGRDGTIVVLQGGGAVAEVWPALGFNCFRWQAGARELLYAAPDLFGEGRPTRSGIPVLFPFPNRIRAGRFAWEGKEYQLEINGPARANAIHGFACRRPWRVIDRGSDDTAAWATGAFRCSIDAPECRDLWPADHEIRITYRLTEEALRLNAEVHNPDDRPLPFGLGYHPYFRIPFTDKEDPASCTVQVPAASYWELNEALPTGRRLPVDEARDLRSPRSFADVSVDDVLTDLPPVPPSPDGLIERASIRGASGVLRLRCSPVFRELVVFTPPHRQAFCIEPYTCTTDAINLQQRGVDAGWRVLPAGERWSASVEMRLEDG
jgi:aldose 1-epimerase